MSTELLCPSCGHHVGTIKVAKAETDDPGSAYMQSVFGLVGRYLEDRTTPAPGQRVGSVELVEDFYRWLAKMTSDSDVSRQALGIALRTLGVEQTRSNGARYYVDLALR